MGAEGGEQSEGEVVHVAVDGRVAHHLEARLEQSPVGEVVAHALHHREALGGLHDGVAARLAPGIIFGWHRVALRVDHHAAVVVAALVFIYYAGEGLAHLEAAIHAHDDGGGCIAEGMVAHLVALVEGG